MPGLWGSATTGAFGRGAEQAAVSQCIEGKWGGPVSGRASGVRAEDEEGANAGLGERVAGGTGSF